MRIASKKDGHIPLHSQLGEQGMRLKVYIIAALLCLTVKASFANGDDASLTQNTYQAEKHIELKAASPPPPQHELTHRENAHVKYIRANAPPSPRHLAYPDRVAIYSGSLRANIQRIVSSYGWQHVAWDVPDDYRWVGTTYIPRIQLAAVLNIILKNYPLQAVLYQGNGVVAIQPRTLR